MGFALILFLPSCYSVQEETEYYGVFSEAEIESINPEAWLEELLFIQKNGLGTHYAESGYPYNTCLWTGIIPKGGNPIAKGWWPYEQSGYLVDGLYRCGIFIDDEELLSLGEKCVEYVLDNPRENGLLGPELLGDNQWAFSVFARVLIAYYDNTCDERVPQLLKAHFEALPEHLTNRQTCIIESMCKMYSVTGDRSIIEKAADIWDEFSIKGTDDNEFFRHQDMENANEVCVHGVTAAEVGKQPAILYLYTGEEKYLDAARGFFESVDKKSGLVDGVPASYEQTYAKSPEALHETCDVSDFLWSYGYMLMATGDTKWADKMETAMFNAALGSISKDFCSHEYFSSPNQVVATHNSSCADYGVEGLARQAYRPGFDTECCSGNVHRMFPNFVSRMWMRTENDGVVAVLYSPSCFETIIKGRSVRIEESTDYPFSDVVEFRFNLDRTVKFPFVFRIPEWAEGASYSINGGVGKTVEAGSFHTVDRKFNSGDVIRIHLPNNPRFVSFYDNGVSVKMGNMLFSVNIKESVKEVRDGFKTSEAFPAYDITPASAWNYALNREDAIEIERSEITGFPWLPENAPIKLKLKGYEVPSWRLENGRTPSLPDEGFVTAEIPAEIEMIPSGCTRIRLTTLPEIK